MGPQGTISLCRVFRALWPIGLCLILVIPSSCDQVWLQSDEIGNNCLSVQSNEKGPVFEACSSENMWRLTKVNVNRKGWDVALGSDPTRCLIRRKARVGLQWRSPQASNASLGECAQLKNSWQRQRWSFEPHGGLSSGRWRLVFSEPAQLLAQRRRRLCLALGGSGETTLRLSSLDGRGRADSSTTSSSSSSSSSNGKSTPEAADACVGFVVTEQLPALSQSLWVELWGTDAGGSPAPAPVVSWWGDGSVSPSPSPPSASLSGHERRSAVTRSLAKENVDDNLVQTMRRRITDAAMRKSARRRKKDGGKTAYQPGWGEEEEESATSPKTSAAGSAGLLTTAGSRHQQASSSPASSALSSRRNLAGRHHAATSRFHAASSSPPTVRVKGRGGGGGGGDEAGATTAAGGAGAGGARRSREVGSGHEHAAWVEPRTGLSFDSVLKHESPPTPSFYPQEERGRGGEGGGGGGGGGGSRQQHLLGGGLYTKWGLPAYVVVMYAEAESEAFLESVALARVRSCTELSSSRATGHTSNATIPAIPAAAAATTDTATTATTTTIATTAVASKAAVDVAGPSDGSEDMRGAGVRSRSRRSGHGGTFKRGAAADDSSQTSSRAGGVAGATAASTIEAAATEAAAVKEAAAAEGTSRKSVKRCAHDLSSDTLGADQHFFLALASPGAFDRTLTLKFALSVSAKTVQQGMLASWRMPLRHKHALLLATQRAQEDASLGHQDCCSWGTELSFTWRGRTGQLELRIDGDLIADLTDLSATGEAEEAREVAAADKLLQLQRWQQQQQQQQGSADAASTGGGQGDGPPSFRAMPTPQSMGELREEMDAALLADDFSAGPRAAQPRPRDVDAGKGKNKNGEGKGLASSTDTTVLTSTTSTTASGGDTRAESVGAAAAVYPSLPRCLWYQYVAEDWATLISPAAKTGFATRVQSLLAAGHQSSGRHDDEADDVDDGGEDDGEDDGGGGGNKVPPLSFKPNRQFSRAVDRITHATHRKEPSKAGDEVPWSVVASSSPTQPLTVPSSASSSEHEHNDAVASTRNDAASGQVCNEVPSVVSMGEGSGDSIRGSIRGSSGGSGGKRRGQVAKQLKESGGRNRRRDSSRQGGEGEGARRKSRAGDPRRQISHPHRQGSPPRKAEKGSAGSSGSGGGDGGDGGKSSRLVGSQSPLAGSKQTAASTPASAAAAGAATAHRHEALKGTAAALAAQSGEEEEEEEDVGSSLGHALTPVSGGEDAPGSVVALAGIVESTRWEQLARLQRQEQRHEQLEATAAAGEEEEEEEEEEKEEEEAESGWIPRLALKEMLGEDSLLVTALGVVVNDEVVNNEVVNDESGSSTDRSADRSADRRAEGTNSTAGRKVAPFSAPRPSFLLSPLYLSSLYSYLSYYFPFLPSWPVGTSLSPSPLSLPASSKVPAVASFTFARRLLRKVSRRLDLARRENFPVKSGTSPSTRNLFRQRWRHFYAAFLHSSSPTSAAAASLSSLSSPPPAVSSSSSKASASLWLSVRSIVAGVLSLGGSESDPDWPPVTASAAALLATFLAVALLAWAAAFLFSCCFLRPLLALRRRMGGDGSGASSAKTGGSGGSGGGGRGSPGVGGGVVGRVKGVYVHEFDPLGFRALCRRPNSAGILIGADKEARGGGGGGGGSGGGSGGQRGGQRGGSGPSRGGAAAGSRDSGGDEGRGSSGKYSSGREKSGGGGGCSHDRSGDTGQGSDVGGIGNGNGKLLAENSVLRKPKPRRRKAKTVCGGEDAVATAAPTKTAARSNGSESAVHLPTTSPTTVTENARYLATERANGRSKRRARNGCGSGGGSSGGSTSSGSPITASISRSARSKSTDGRGALRCLSPPSFALEDVCGGGGGVRRGN